MDSTAENEASADTNGGLNVWQLDDDLEYDCNCPGPPPPVFKIPPPPRPPFMPEIDCSDFNTQDFDSCDLMTVIDAGYHGSPTIPTLTIVGICSALLLAGAFIVFAFAWKNKKKVQNFLPCKSSPHQNRCDPGHGNGVIYEDLAPVRPRTAVSNHSNSFEMLDVKTARGNSYVIGARPPMFICSPIVRQEHEYGPPPRQDCRRQHCNQDLYNPVYEELSNGSGEKADSDGESECTRVIRESEDEFAEDELSLGDHHCHLHNNNNNNNNTQQSSHSATSSLQGSTGNDLCRDVDSSDADDRSRFLCHRAVGPPCSRASNTNHHHRDNGGASCSIGRGRNMSLPPASRRAGRRQYGGDNTAGRQHVNHCRSQQRPLPEQKRPRSLDRKHHHHHHHHHHNNNNNNNRNNVDGPAIIRQQQQQNPPSSSDYGNNEFHEGFLMDALYQLYPPPDNYNTTATELTADNHQQQQQSANQPYILPITTTTNRPTIPVIRNSSSSSSNHNNRLVDPYESVPVLEQIRSHRDTANIPGIAAPFGYQHNHNQQHHHRVADHDHQHHRAADHDHQHHRADQQQHHAKCQQQQHSTTMLMADDDGNNDIITTTSFRSPPIGKPTSQDSDSGYSNNTSGGRGSSSSRSRNDNLPAHVLASPCDYPL